MYVKLLTHGKVCLTHAAPHNKFRFQTERRNGIDASTFFMPHRGNANLKLRHAKCIELTRDAQLLFQRKRYPGGLFAVAQGSVVDDD